MVYERRFRHITPKFLESGQTSRTISSSSQNVPMSPTITITTAPDAKCQSGGVHPPSKEYMKDFVRTARRRIKYISVCGSGGVPNDIAAEVSLNFRSVFIYQNNTLLSSEKLNIKQF